MRCIWLQPALRIEGLWLGEEVWVFVHKDGGHAYWGLFVDCKQVGWRMKRNGGSRLVELSIPRIEGPDRERFVEVCA